eukprot:298344-Pelagomonas_calceolata.AAC.10
MLWHDDARVFTSEAAGGSLRRQISQPSSSSPLADSVLSNKHSLKLSLVKHLTAQATWDGLSPEMYGLFWTLTVHDIYVPTKTYEREMDKVGGAPCADKGRSFGRWMVKECFVCMSAMAYFALFLYERIGWQQAEASQTCQSAAAVHCILQQYISSQQAGYCASSLHAHVSHIARQPHLKCIHAAKSELRAVETRLAMARSSGPLAMSEEEVVETGRLRDRLRVRAHMSCPARGTQLKQQHT